MNATLQLFALAGVVHAANAVLAQPRKEDLIPPEILQQMNPDIRSRTRAIITLISQDDIFGLRDQPRLDADFVSFCIPLANLSTVQRRIIDDWVRSGHNRILQGTNRLRLTED